MEVRNLKLSDLKETETPDSFRVANAHRRGNYISKDLGWVGGMREWLSKVSDICVMVADFLNIFTWTLEKGDQNWRV